MSFMEEQITRVACHQINNEDEEGVESYDPFHCSVT